ncbi:Glutamine synthetase adenylyltransferase [Ignavibacterium album JCM 16511]|uniref:Glutamine synthetase adenylyltransferase n=1 Tax=Ignavibacterium album (strain DSM 19864 / JCM 16511 / NBRC 101810 / Mat9-16) TaxID=945713 RepID=I0AM94_IGNAJ|nr:glutamine-synthetase adenylyltransferase [Ignavibacterium album]AFH50101.1 Glutamine synthetase adenylyltransferase [Ignavibacterium album JCM 16511]
MYRRKKLSENFINKFVELCAGKVSATQIDKFISETDKLLLDFYFTETSEANLLRLIQSQFDLSFFISDLLSYPHHLEVIISVSVHSNYLTDILVRNPEYFYWVVNPEILRFKPDEKYFNEVVKKSTDIFKSFDSKVNALKNVKKKEILRIGLRDFYRYDDLVAVTTELSQLASAISSKLFSLCYEEILNKYKIGKTNRKYCVIALGKLGAQELNYSSDIDLICFYDKNALINKKYYYNEIINETIKLFIETSTQITSNGYLYRIDFRLRPDGRNSPLANSISEYIRYYETRSEDWERQMLIKTGFLSGSKSLYKKFFDFKERIVFSSSANVTPFVQIKKLKQSIEQRAADEDNIKLSSGGIRDIEFSVQALQLVNGKKYPQVRAASTLNAMLALNKHKIITDKETLFLINTYKLYRRIEHYLQLMNDRQTHSIPENGELLEKIAFYLGYKNSSEFKSELNKIRKQVTEFYKSVMQSEEESAQQVSINFKDKLRARNNIEFLRTGKSLLGTKQFDSRTTEAFEKISKQLNDYLSKSSDPDLVLENLARIIKTVPLPKIWYDEFSDEKFFRLFLMMCEFSQKSVNKFFEDNFIKDDLLSRTCFDNLDEENFSIISLPQLHFRVCIQLLNKNINAQDSSTIISRYHFHKIQSIINKEKLSEHIGSNYFIAGLGSFGSEEMNFSSDIDLIFVVKELNKHNNVQKIFQTLLNKMKNEIKGTEIDCRLRPEGKSSYLVWDIDEYKKYVSNRARVWELQALTKCRFIEGEKKLFDELLQFFIRRVKNLDDKILKSEIIQMRTKLISTDETGFHIKRSKGGITDLDFIISYFMLKNISEMKKLIGSSVPDKLQKLSAVMDDKDAESIKQNYLFLKMIEVTIQNIFDFRTAKLPIDKLQLQKLSLQLGFESQEDFIRHFNEITLSNIRLFRKYIGE